MAKIKAADKVAIFHGLTNGETQQQLADRLGVVQSDIAYHAGKMKTGLAAYRKNLAGGDDHAIEDLTNILTYARYRTLEQLSDDEKAAEIPIRDLAQVHKEAFNARQLMRKEPTDIPGVPGTEIKGRENIDRIAIADEFNRNFIHLQRAAINAMSVEGDIEEGEFDECQAD